ERHREIVPLSLGTAAVGCLHGWMGFQLVVLKPGYVELRALRDRFIELLRGLGRSPATVRAYVAAVDRYAGQQQQKPCALDTSSSMPYGTRPRTIRACPSARS